MSYKIALNYPQGKNKQRKIWILNSLVYLLLGGINIFSEKFHYFGIAYAVSGGVALIFVLYFYKKATENDYFIEFTPKELKYKRYKRKLLNIPWGSIEKIKEHPTELQVYLKNLNKLSVELAEVNYKEVREVKAKLKEYTEMHNIPYLWNINGDTHKAVLFCNVNN